MTIYSQSTHNILEKTLQRYNRLVVLDKLRLNTRKEEAKALAAKGGVDDNIIVLPPSASKGGVLEKMIKVDVFLISIFHG
jgi:hypothetical protein